MSHSNAIEDGLEAELEAALAGFDAATFEVASPRDLQSDRVRSAIAIGAKRAGPEPAPAR